MYFRKHIQKKIEIRERFLKKVRIFRMNEASTSCNLIFYVSLKIASQKFVGALNLLGIKKAVSMLEMDNLELDNSNTKGHFPCLRENQHLNMCW